MSFLMLSSSEPAHFSNLVLLFFVQSTRAYLHRIGNLFMQNIVFFWNMSIVGPGNFKNCCVFLRMTCELLRKKWNICLREKWKNVRIHYFF